MNERNNSGAFAGYSPDQQPRQQYQPQPFQAQQYAQYQPQQQYGQYQQPLQQYQQVQPQQQYGQQAQPVQPQQQYGQQAQQYQPFQPPVYQVPYQEPQEPEKVQRKGGGFLAFIKRRDVVVLIAAIICTAWLLISYNTIGGMLDAAPTGDSAEELGQAVGTALGAAMTIPFFIVAFVGQIFNWVAWLTSRKGFVLTAAILYCVSLLFGFSYGLGMIPCIVLGFIGYARLKKRQQ